MVIFLLLGIVILASVFYLYKDKNKASLNQSPDTTIHQGTDVTIDYADTNITGIVVEDSGPKENTTNQGPPLRQDRSN